MSNDAGRGPNITTSLNEAFFLIDPTPDLINIEDIAHGLSNVCRYVGQCTPFYSVAEHCVRMCGMVEEKAYIQSEEHIRNAKLAALLHDSTEAYLGDVSSGLKSVLPRYKEIENNLLAVILEKYEVTMVPEVEVLDVEIRVIEVMNLFPRGHNGWDFEEPETFPPIVPWSPTLAESAYLKEFKELTDGRYQY
jgi:hypothetical protein